jgi:hypothetical protein
MSDHQPFRVITSSPRGASVNGGHAVKFDLRFEDETEEAFVCEAARYQALLGNLQHYGALAENVRLAAPGQPVRLASPYIVTRVSGSGTSDAPPLVAIEFATEQGIPVQIAMSPVDAQKTIEFLERELENLAHSPGPPKTN